MIVDIVDQIFLAAIPYPLQKVSLVCRLDKFFVFGYPPYQVISEMKIRSTGQIT
jgi:hypothetical protein